MAAGIQDPLDLPLRQQHDSHGDPIGLPMPAWTGAPRPSGVTLDGVRVRAEPLAVVHAPGLHAAFSRDADGRLWTYMAHGPFADAAAFAAWTEKAAGQPDPLFFHLARRDGTPVGVAALLRIQPELGVIEIVHPRSRWGMRSSPVNRRESRPAPGR